MLINPFNLKDFFIDIKNFITLYFIIRKNKKTADWQRFNLRTDYINRIYTVFNPRKEEIGDSVEMLELKIGERMIPCHKYIDSLGLSEIVGVSGEKIQDTESYLVVYYQIYKWVTPWRILYHLILLMLIIVFRKEILYLFYSIYMYFI